MGVTMFRNKNIKELNSTNLAANANIATTALAEGASFFKKDGSVVATGDFDMASKKVKGLAAAVNADEAVNKGQLDTAINSAVGGVISGMDYVGDWDASTAAYPTQTLKGRIYTVTVAGTVDGEDYAIGDYITSKVENPSTTSKADWVKTDNTETQQTIATVTGLQTALDEKQAVISFVDYEVPAGVKDGVNVTFTLAHTPVGGLILNLGGAIMTPGAGNDFEIVGNTITMDAIQAPAATENFWASYRY